MSAASSQLSQEFECSLCLSEIDNPKVMGQCLHSACFKCINEYVKINRDRRMFPCPICKADCNIPAGGVSQLKTDFKLKSILEQYKLETDKQAKRRKTSSECTACGEPATVFCEQCGSVYLCTLCSKKHRLSSATMKHILSSLCADHGKVLSFFCMKCSDYVCSICSFSLHQDHEVRLRTDIANEVFSKLPAVVNKLHDVSRRFQRTIEAYSRNINEIYPKDEQWERSRLDSKYNNLVAASTSEVKLISDQVAHLEQQLQSLQSKKAVVQQRLVQLQNEKKTGMDKIKKKYAEEKQHCEHTLKKAKREKSIIAADLELSEEIQKKWSIKKESLVSAVNLVRGDARFDKIMAYWGEAAAFR